MLSAHPGLELIDGKRVYILRQHCKAWFVDGDNRQVEAKRFGFPVVPDFGRTAHSYCGTSLDACIGDLLDLWQKPQTDASVCGYIIQSSVRLAENLLLARPYSPKLFASGAPSGPKYMLEVFRGNVAREDALLQWKEEEERADALAELESEKCKDRWPLDMKFPCLHCGEEKPLGSYTTAPSYAGMWRDAVSKGQDLVCLPCRQKLGRGMFDSIIACSLCCRILPKKAFAVEIQNYWKQMQEGVVIAWKKYTGEFSGRDPLDLSAMYTWCGKLRSPQLAVDQELEDTQGRTQAEHLAQNFVTRDLVHALASGVAPKCAKCRVAEAELEGTCFTCNGCLVS